MCDTYVTLTYVSVTPIFFVFKKNQIAKFISENKNLILFVSFVCGFHTHKLRKTESEISHKFSFALFAEIKYKNEK